jgi:RNA polymerase sigma-70 factor (ECF subfamily)
MSIACTMGRSRAATRTGSETADETLIQSIAAGDRQAMKVLFARHNVRLYRFVLRMVREEAAAEDLVSEVFLEVWRHADKFQTRSSVSTWLLAIGRNKALSALRRRRPTEELDGHAAQAVEDLQDGPEAVMQARQASGILGSCLERLSPAHRAVIDLVYCHDKSIEEVAQIVSASPNTVKTRMFYARKRIAEMMAAQGFDRAIV